MILLLANTAFGFPVAMTKLRKLNLSGFIANEVQVKKFEWKVYYRPFFFNRDVFASDEEEHFQ